MITVIPALALIAIVGASLYRVLPNFDPDATRRQCGTLVLNVMLPALNIEVIYTAPIGHHLWQVPIAMTCGVAVCVSAALLMFSVFPIDRRLKNSLILGSAFGNVTYLGMPLLRGLFPQSVIDVTTVAILCEITVTSLDLTTGTILAAASDHVGEHVSVRAVATQILKFPLLWSVAIAVAIRVLGIPLPPFVLSALHLLGDATSGIMLLVLGMAIKPAALIGALRRIGTWWPMLPIKLGLSPLVVAFAGVAIGLSGLNHRATILEAAMPPQLFVFIVADRFGFDTEVLATAVAFLTVTSFLTLPLLHYFLG